MTPDIHITAAAFRWFLLGNVLGAAVGGAHYYLLRQTVNWCVSLQPGTAKMVVMLIFYLRFAVLAVVLYLILRLAGIPLALGLISGISLLQISWIILQIKASYKEKFPG